MTFLSTGNCPDLGVWRTWLDQEDVSPGLVEHLPGCPACRQMVAELRDDAAAVHDALSLLAPESVPSAAESAAARERLEWQRRGRSATLPVSIPVPLQPKEREPIPMFFTRISTPWRVAASGIAAALALGMIVAFTPGGSDAAAAFLAQFRSQEVTAISVTPQTQGQITRTLNALGNLGTVTLPGSPAGQVSPQAAARGVAAQSTTTSLAAAGQSIGFALQTPDPALLPAGMDRTPQVRVTPASQVRFTFDQAKARAYFQSIGHPEVSVPDKFNGASLVVSIPSAAIIQYGSTATRDALIVGQAGELVVDVQGGNVSLLEMRDFLLSLPGLPADVVNQLKQIQNWNDTLPIPVPVDTVNWQAATFNGNKGLLLNDNSGVGSAAIWHANGHLVGIAGSLKASDLQRIANSLAVR